MVPQFWNLSFYHFPRPDSFWAAGKNFTSLLPPTPPTHISGVLSLKFSPKSYYLLTVYPDTDHSRISPAIHKNSLAYITLASLPRFHFSPTRMDLPSRPQVGLTSSADLNSSKVKLWVPTVPLCINLLVWIAQGSQSNEQKCIWKKISSWLLLFYIVSSWWHLKYQKTIV